MYLPPPISWLWEGWKIVGHAIGRVMSFIILTILWIIGFGIYGIVMKIIALFTKEEKKESYWIDLEPMTDESLTQQF